MGGGGSKLYIRPYCFIIGGGGQFPPVPQDRRPGFTPHTRSNISYNQCCGISRQLLWYFFMKNQLLLLSLMFVVCVYNFVYYYQNYDYYKNNISLTLKKLQAYKKTKTLHVIVGSQYITLITLDIYTLEHFNIIG